MAGWVPSVFDTLMVRSLSNFYWFRRNLLVLRPASKLAADQGPFSLDDLESSEAERVSWIHQPAAECGYPLQLGLPPLIQA